MTPPYLNLRTPLALIFSVAVCTLVSGCSYIEELYTDAEKPVEPKEASTPAESASNSERVAPQTKQGTEIVWIVPSEPVDGFVVRYGPNSDSLTQEVKVPTSQLRPSADPMYGQVYRYVLQGAESMSPVFVSIASFKGEQISEFSAVMEEQPAGSSRQAGSPKSK